MERLRQVIRVALAAGIAGAAFVLSATGAVCSDESSDRLVRSGDFKAAAQHLSKEAAAGIADSQYELASLYRLGRGVAQDDALAFKWAMAAARQDHVRAAYMVGSMLLSGRGAKIDRQLAERWLSFAAAHGHEGAVRLMSELSKSPTPQSLPKTNTSAIPQIGDQKKGQAARIQAALKAGQTGARPLIVDAAHRGDLETVRLAVQSGADVNSRDTDGRTALMLASAAGYASIAEFLLARGADPNLIDIEGSSSMIFAVENGRADILAQLIYKRGDLTLRNKKNERAADLALDRCDAQSMQLMFRSGDHPPEPRPDGTTALMRASQRCREDVNSLLAIPGTLEHVDQQGRTALWHASNSANFEAIKFLLGAGARAGRADNAGETPLFRAAARGSGDAVRALITKGGDLNRQSASGNTALIVAAGSGCEACVVALVGAHASLDIRNGLGESALMVASREGHAGIIKTLVSAGANTGLRNKRRETAHDIAVASGQVLLLEILK